MEIYDQLVSPQILRENLGQDNWRVIDCRFDLMAPSRGYSDYLQEHIPGALYAHLDDDLAAPVRADTGRHPLPEVGAFAAKLGNWGIDNNTQVVVYDGSSGAIAARLWWMLRWLGHQPVAVLDSGFAGWLEFGGRVDAIVPQVDAKKFIPDESGDAAISSDELVALLDAADDYILVDARDEQRFRGKVEPIDAIAGHIPGARSLPFHQCLAPTGEWLDPESVRDSWSSVLDKAPTAEWAVMCGSGVTACHLALSAEIAGLRAPRLYVGSWSEWIRDPSRKIASASAPEAADRG